MNIETGEIRDIGELTAKELGSGFWHRIESDKQKHEAKYNIENGTNVNLKTRSSLSNTARNKRKKMKKMSQKSKVKNRSK